MGLFEIEGNPEAASLAQDVQQLRDALIAAHKKNDDVCKWMLGLWDQTKESDLEHGTKGIIHTVLKYIYNQMSRDDKFPELEL